MLVNKLVVYREIQALEFSSRSDIKQGGKVTENGYKLEIKDLIR